MKLLAEVAHKGRGNREVPTPSDSPLRRLSEPSLNENPRVEANEPVISGFSLPVL